MDRANYYTYAYLRVDKTPYYIGKGQGDRIHSKHRLVAPPADKSRMIFLKQNLTEEEAFKHEIYMIDVFGRKDLGTGILHNRTNGGDGVSGLIHSEETKAKMSESTKGQTHSDETKIIISESQKGEKNSMFGRSGEFSPTFGRPHSEESKRIMSEKKKGENHPFFGTKWWNDGCGNCTRMKECPGDGWKLGRK